MSIVEEAPGYIQVFSDGTVKRVEYEIALPSWNPTDNAEFISKDVDIDPNKPIRARIFLPNKNSPSSTHHSPVIVYFHGGGFCIGSTKWTGYHHFLGYLATAAGAIILSIEYRLAPENRLPVAYEDCYDSLEWLSHQVTTGSEPWLAGADLSRVFLSGDSAGGNICHHVALQAVRNQASGCGLIKIRGLLPLHPYFGTQRRTARELVAGAETDVAMNDVFWRMSLPDGADRDHFGPNFETAAKGVTAEEWQRFPRAVVHVAGHDFLKERGVLYAEFLKGKGVEVEMVEAPDEGHVYFVYNPVSEAAGLLRQRMSEFVNGV